MKSWKKVPLLFASFVMFLSLQVEGNESNLQRDFGDRGLDIEDGNAINERPALNDEYNYLRDLMSRRANVQLAQSLLKAVDERLMRLKKKRTSICLPSTDCDFANWGDEADAKDILMPGRDTNPGRRRRRRRSLTILGTQKMRPFH